MLEFGNIKRSGKRKLVAVNLEGTQIGNIVFEDKEWKAEIEGKYVCEENEDWVSTECGSYIAGKVGLQESKERLQHWYFQEEISLTKFIQDWKNRQDWI